MSNDRLHSLYRSYRRRSWLVVTGMILFAAAVAWAVPLPSGSLAWLVVVLTAYFAFLIPLVSVDGTMELATEKPPEQVRTEFLGAESPFLWQNRQQTTAVRSDGSCTTLETESPIFNRGAEVTYDATETDRGIHVEIRHNESQYSQSEIEISQQDGQTYVTVTLTVLKPLNLHRVLHIQLSNSVGHEAYEAQGYEVLDDSFKFHLRS